MIYKEEKIIASRNMMVMDIAEDGSLWYVFWMSKAFDVAHDTMFHPKSLYKQIIDNVGYATGYTQPLAVKAWKL